MSARIWAPAAVLLFSALALVERVTTHGPSPLWTLLVVAFLTIAPGLAVVGPLGLSDPWLQAALVPALSLSIDVMVAGILAYTNHWSPTAAILVLVAICLAGALARELRPCSGATR